MKIRALAVAFLAWFCAPAAADMGCGSGNPNCLVPTAPVGTNNNRAASTAFVNSTLNSPTVGAWLKSGQGTGSNASATGFGPSYQAGYVVGALTGTGVAPYSLVSVADTATASAAYPALRGEWLAHNINTGAGAGNREAFTAILTKNVTTPGTDPAYKFYSAIFGQTYIKAADGGSGGTPLGNAYGVNGIVQLENGATFYNGATNEFDVSVQTGASVAYKSGLSIVSVNSDAVKGSSQDTMLVFTADNTTTAKFSKIVTIGRGDSLWPGDSSTTLLGTDAPATGSRVANNGVDFSGVTFSGCAFKSNGYCILQNGALNDVSAQVTGDTPTTTGAGFGGISRYFEEWYGTPYTGAIVHRANRLLVGEAALGGAGVNASGGSGAKSWLDDFMHGAAAAGAISSGSQIGGLAGVFYARTSDFRAFTGTPTGGAEGIVAAAVNDDSDSIAAAIDARAIRASTGYGISVSQMDALNLGPDVVDWQVHEPGGTAFRGRTVALLLTSGTAETFTDTVTITNASPGVVTYTGAKRIVNDTPVALSTTGALPSPLVAGTTYYVVGANIAAKTFKVAATPGGAALNTTTAGSGTHTVKTNIARPISAHLMMAGDGVAVARKAIGVTDQALDTTVGSSGGGVFADLPVKAETRWIDTANAVQESVWGDTTGFVVKDGRITAPTNTDVTIAGQGTGKLVFSASGSGRWAVSALTGNLEPLTDAVYDFGKSAARPRDIYLSRNVVVGGATGFSGSKVAGACTFTISGGIITNVTGC